MPELTPEELMAWFLLNNALEELRPLLDNPWNVFPQSEPEDPR